MSASTAIGMVGESLKAMLDTEMSLSSTVVTTILAPDESNQRGRINLFLYKIMESPYQKNMDWQVAPNDSQRLVPPPLTLNLYYLMTPYAQNDPDTGNTNAHAMLGEAMRVFHENPTVPQEYLVEGLLDARERINISQVQLDMDELSKLWSTFSEPFRLSVLYEVSVVQIDQEEERRKDMPSRVRHIGIPVIEAPFKPPEITGLNPISGPAGSDVRIDGDHLDGWRAYVTVSGVNAVIGQEISGNFFLATIPASLPQGFHRISIDISRLARATFFYEVTP